MKEYYTIEAPMPNVLSSDSVLTFSIFHKVEEWIYFKSILQIELTDHCEIGTIYLWVRIPFEAFQSIENLEDVTLEVDAVSELPIDLGKFQVRFDPNFGYPLVVLTNKDYKSMYRKQWQGMLEAIVN